MRVNTVANWITTGRLILYFLIIVILYNNLEGWYWLTIPLFTLVFLADKLDGWVARKFNQTTDIGVYLDWSLDRAIVLITMLFYVMKTGMDGIFWLLVINITRDSILAGVRQLALKNNIFLKTTMIGKIKYVFENLGIIMMIYIITTGNRFETVNLNTILFVIFAITSILGIYSMINYFKQIFK